MTGTLRLFLPFGRMRRHAMRCQRGNLLSQEEKVPPENLHITLAFLGEQPARAVPGLSELLQGISSGVIRLQLDRMGYFSHSRISWAGMHHVPEELTRLYEQLAGALAEKAIFHDKRNRFKPHVTLARHSSRPVPSGLKPIIWQADSLVLVESRSGQDKKGGPPQYIRLAERMLG